MEEFIIFQASHAIPIYTSIHRLVFVFYLEFDILFSFINKETQCKNYQNISENLLSSLELNRNRGLRHFAQ